MSARRTVVSVQSKADKHAKPLNPKPLSEVSKTVEVEDGVDVYLVLGNLRYQLSRHQSPFFEGEEYRFHGVLEKDQEILFVHKDGRKIPINDKSNCGYTLVGKARKYFRADKGLTCNGEASDDQEYIYITQHSSLHYIGETGEHSIFIRVYDNLSGLENDRWVVIYFD